MGAARRPTAPSHQKAANLAAPGSIPPKVRRRLVPTASPHLRPVEPPVIHTVHTPNRAVIHRFGETNQPDPHGMSSPRGISHGDGAAVLDDTFGQ